MRHTAIKTASKSPPVVTWMVRCQNVTFLLFLLPSLHRRDLRLAVLGKQVIQRLGQQLLNRRAALCRQDAQLLLHLWREIAGDVALSFATRTEEWPPALLGSARLPFRGGHLAPVAGRVGLALHRLPQVGGPFDHERPRFAPETPLRVHTQTCKPVQPPGLPFPPLRTRRPSVRPRPRR